MVLILVHRLEVEGVILHARLKVLLVLAADVIVVDVVVVGRRGRRVEGLLGSNVQAIAASAEARASSVASSTSAIEKRFCADTRLPCRRAVG